MNWKWNCKGDIIQIFLSEINLAGENGSQGHNFGKFLNSEFVKGLRNSAVVDEELTNDHDGLLLNFSSDKALSSDILLCGDRKLLLKW